MSPVGVGSLLSIISSGAIPSGYRRLSRDVRRRLRAAEGEARAHRNTSINQYRAQPRQARVYTNQDTTRLYGCAGVYVFD